MVATTVTTTAATTATSASIVGAGAELGAVVVVTLIVLLITKELAGAAEGSRAQRLSRVVDVGAFPLLLTFGAIVISKVLAVLA
jgi:hypothetical protein